MTEQLCDEQILKKMKKTLIPQVLSDKLDRLSAQVEVLTKQLATKEQRISELENKVMTLEAQTDAVEQYSCRAKLRFQGIPDSGDGEDSDSLIIKIIIKHMNIELRVQGNNIERSHRVGPKLDKQGLIIMASTSIPAEIVRLIELVQSEECMWDMSSAVCHDRNNKRSMVQTIAESLELQGRVSFLPNQQQLRLSQLMSTA